VFIQTITLAAIGGILPAVLWLLFWLREDKKRPEPRGLIIATFLLGMVAVVVTLPLELFTSRLIGEGLLLLLVWALIEEGLKFFAAGWGGLRTRAYDEPIDGLIYLITAALGFAALENAFFLFAPIQEGEVLISVITGNVRFIGATLLHTVTSAIVGISVALCFGKPWIDKIIYTGIGLVTAVVLHALFNYFILSSDSTGMFIVFSVVWVGVVGLIIVFEKFKRANR